MRIEGFRSPETGVIDSYQVDARTRTLFVRKSSQGSYTLSQLSSSNVGVYVLINELDNCKITLYVKMPVG